MHSFSKSTIIWNKLYVYDNEIDFFMKHSNVEFQRIDWNCGLNRELIAVLVSAHIKSWCQSIHL